MEAGRPVKRLLKRYGGSVRSACMEVRSSGGSWAIELKGPTGRSSARM